MRGVDAVPIAEALGQSAPLTSVLGHIQERVQELQMGDAYIADTLTAEALGASRWSLLLAVISICAA